MKKSTKLVVILSFCMFIVSVALVTVLAVTDFGLTAHGFIRFGLDKNIDVTFSQGHLENMTSSNDSFQSFTVNKDNDDNIQAVEGYQSWVSGITLNFTEDSEGMGRLVFTVINNAPVNSDEHLRVSFSTNTTVNSSISATPSADFCIRPGSSHTFDIEFVAQNINYSTISSSFQIRIDVNLYTTENMIGLDDDGWFIDEDYGTEIQMELDELRHTATITHVENYSEDSMLPHYVTYEGKIYTVNAIDSPSGDAVFYNAYDNISSISFPTTMTYLGAHIFENSKTLTSISLPHSVEYIGESAFIECTNLAGTAMLPPRLKTIGAYAFQNTKISGTLRIPRGLEIISDSAFSCCKNLTGLILPEGLTRISDSAFCECDNLAGNLILPNTVKYLGECCFYDCPKLTGQLIIPPSVIEISGEAFRGCTGFSALRLNEGLEVIGFRAFKELDNLQGSLYLPTTLREIGIEAFCLTGFDGELIIPEGITTISGGAFASINNFFLLVLPKSLQKISSSAFNNTYFDVILCYADVLPLVEVNGFAWDEETHCYVPDASYSDYENAGWDSFSLYKLSEWEN